MPAPIDEIVKRRVIQQWLAGETREKIVADNNIASGTISIIVDEYKVQRKHMLPPNSERRGKH